MKPFFITGLSRSGTTLLEKILCNHPDSIAFYQPFPQLYRKIKKDFFKEISYPETYYVLNNLFRESVYREQDFIDFLNLYKVELEWVKEKMLSNGLHPKSSVLQSVERSSTMNLGQAYELLLKSLLPTAKSVSMLGAKEINCEEFSTYFLQQGIKCVVILRDPRDVITSLNAGNGKDFGGVHRPTLFHVRNWRKSVAYCLKHIQNPDFHYIKYEDLVTTPDVTMRSVTDFLGLSPFAPQVLLGTLLDESGNPWRANSSLNNDQTEISPSSIGNFSSHLTDQVIRYIEFTCHPEMLRLGYKQRSTMQDIVRYDPGIFEEQFDVAWELTPEFANRELSAADEAKRIELFMRAKRSENVNPVDAHQFFLDPSVLSLLTQRAEP